MEELDLNVCIKSEDFFRIGKRTVVCLLTLKNGFEIVSSSSCSKEENFNQATGEAISRELAYQKLYEYLVIRKGLL